MSNALAILGDGYTIQITPDAEAQKATIIEASRRIVAVTDADSCDIAQSRLKALAAVRIAVEKSRNEVKRPVIDLGRKIDGIAHEFSADIVSEETRLDGLVKDYVREQQRIAREAREAAERERQRIEREEHDRKMQALRAEQEAERQRMEAVRQHHEAEIARLRAERQQDEAAQAEARRRELEAAQAQREAAERAEAARLAAEQAAAEARRQEEAATAAVVAPVIPQGVREEIDFEVVDVAEFAAKFPALVTITPKRADILAALKKSFARKGVLPDVPGLRVFQNLKIKPR
jgi:type I site-specific restriction-modification system R (restriction) subunit